jgi:hypothetical protein
MRLSVIALAILLAAPALAQEVRVPHAPPPEGFYRNTNGAYDLLFRPYAPSEIRMVKDLRLPRGLDQHAISAPEALAAPLPPPCEPPPTANRPAQKPAGPRPCPAPR